MSRRRRASAEPGARRAAGEAAQGDGAATCPLCLRPIPPDARSSLHHLVPRLKGGGRLGTVRLHQICHSTIHALFTEAELARRLNNVEALRGEPALAPFLAWIATKPDGFHARTARGGSRRGGPSRRR